MSVDEVGTGINAIPLYTITAETDIYIIISLGIRTTINAYIETDCIVRGEIHRSRVGEADEMIPIRSAVSEVDTELESIVTLSKTVIFIIVLPPDRAVGRPASSSAVNIAKKTYSTRSAVWRGGGMFKAINYKGAVFWFKLTGGYKCL